MTPSITAARRGVVQRRPRRHVRLVSAVALGAASIATTFVPALRTDALEWVPLVLVVPLVLWCAWPVHQAAACGVVSGRWTPDVLATIGILAAFAWSVHALLSDRAVGHLVPVALATVLMVAAQHVGEEAGVDDPYASSPVWLTPLVLVVAASAMAAWWTTDGSGSATSAALSALLIAGPGALRLATPAALLVGTRRGAQAGILVASRTDLDMSTQVDTVLLDQHGTITTGALSVVSVDPVDPEHLRNLRWFAGALERSSDHPIARAIAQGTDAGRVSDVVQRPGLGISGSVDRHPVRVGRPSWIGIDDPGGLGTRVGVEVDARVLGSITLADTLRPHAQDDVERLRSLGVEPFLVSDGPALDTRDLADRSGIVTSHAEMTVEDRMRLVERLRADGRIVAVVGDAGRHGAAMQAADLALSTGGEVPVTGIVLPDVDVRTVGDALALTRATASTARANHRWAPAAMLAPLPFAAGGLVDPAYASAICLLGMIGVALNSLRIPRMR